MKELATDFKTIFKKDRGLIGWMALNIVLSLGLFLIPIINLNPTKPKVWARYSDVANGYSQAEWWYLLGFSVIALTIGVGHTLICARLYSKRGKDIARLFIGVSMAIAIIAARFLLNIVLEG